MLASVLEYDRLLAGNEEYFEIAEAILFERERTQYYDARGHFRGDDSQSLISRSQSSATREQAVERYSRLES